MTRHDVTPVIVCVGGLGTRTAGWARYVPKEFYPVGGRPAIVHLLEEIAQLGPAETVIVCHPYYAAFTSWASTALSQKGHDSYRRAARLPTAAAPLDAVSVSFITQHGPYADITSVLNGADYLATRGEVYVAFADNLYPGNNPALVLRAAPPGHLAVLGRQYQPELAASRGVIAAVPRDGHMVMSGLAEKPGPRAARMLERRYGVGNLLLLEGRSRLTSEFISFAHSYQAPPGTEPKLAVAIAAWARSHPVIVITTTSQVVDLGTSQSHVYELRRATGNTRLR